MISRKHIDWCLFLFPLKHGTNSSCTSMEKRNFSTSLRVDDNLWYLSGHMLPVSGISFFFFLSVDLSAAKFG